MPIISGGGGGGPASGSYLPVADKTGVTVDTTTYDNGIKGSGKYTTLIFPAASETGMIAVATSGDAFPSYVIGSQTYDGILIGDGAHDPSNHLQSAQLAYDADSSGTPGGFSMSNHLALGSDCKTSSQVPRLSQLSPRFSQTSGNIPTLTVSSGVGTQIDTTRDAETITPFTGDGTNNAATCAIALSPDNVTYSLLDTLSIAAAVNLTGVLALSVNIRVPGGWYLKLTAVHGTIGTTTYY
jgi:hypothetical protein